jgi:hypothetical protein
MCVLDSRTRERAAPPTRGALFRIFATSVKHSNSMWQLVSRFLNFLLLGDPREPLSARMGRRIERKNCKFCRLVCFLLAAFEPEHCRRSWERRRKTLDARR